MGKWTQKELDDAKEKAKEMKVVLFPYSDEDLNAYTIIETLVPLAESLCASFEDLTAGNFCQAKRTPKNRQLAK